MNGSKKPYPWGDAPYLLQKLQKMGWIISASHISREGSGECVIEFSPEGEAALKPFADLWERIGGLTEGEMLALFNVAVLSQKK